MTEKRFRYVHSYHSKDIIVHGIFDEETKQFYSGEILSNCGDLLNEQHETIQQLQKDNKILMDKMFVMRTNNAFEHCKKYKTECKDIH